MTSFGVWFPAFAGTLSGSRLASAAGGLGRDDELRHSLLAIRSESSNSGTDVSTRNARFRRYSVLHTSFWSLAAGLLAGQILEPVTRECS